jgi:hypothetical protein
MPPLKDLIGKKPSDKKSSASEPTEIDPVGRDLMNAMLAHFKPKFEDPDKAQGKDDPAKDPATGANPTTEE